jgi:hypothetical protein
MKTKDLTDAAPVDFQLLVWGWCVTDRRDARDVVTRLNAASDFCEVRAGHQGYTGADRHWDRDRRWLLTFELRTRGKVEPTPWSWALSGCR